MRNSVDTEYERECERRLVRGNGGLGTQNARPVRFLAHAVVSQACPAFLLPTANRCGLRLCGHSADASAVKTTPRCYFWSQSVNDICKPHASSANSRSRRHPPPLTFHPTRRDLRQRLCRALWPPKNPNATQRSPRAVGPACKVSPLRPLPGLSPKISSIRMASSQTS